MAFVVWLDAVGVRIKDMIRVPARLEISNSTDSSETIQVRHCVLRSGPAIGSDAQAKMRLLHFGLYEISASQTDGEVFARELVAVGDNRKVRVVVKDGEFVELRSGFEHASHGSSGGQTSIRL